MKRVPWPAVVAALLLGLGAWWLVTETEWVEVDEPAPLRGEAAKKPHYAAMQVLRRLGVRVVERPNLDQMPPPGATLVLSSFHWSMFAQRVPALKAWVERGGHLVVPPSLVRGERDMRWVPIDSARKPQAKPGEPEIKDYDDEPAPRRAPNGWLPGLARPMGCSTLREPAAVDASFGEPRTMKVCGFNGLTFQPNRAPVQWQLDGRLGAEAMRVGLGAGSVAVLGRPSFDGSRDLLLADNALAFVAALGRPAPGSTVWFVVEESRTPLLPWLWQQGWIAIALGLAALAAALWRNGTRFGPLAAPTVPGRRAVSEQIRGTAEFIWHRGPRALHAAQLRALDEVAQRRLRHYARLVRGERAAALARATGLDAEALGHALDPHLDRPRHAWPAALALLEEARRRLLASSSPSVPKARP